MPNTPKRLDSETSRFIDEFAALQVPWGMPQTTGRVYAYLLLSESPVSLDEITEALSVAKSSVSVSTRALERAQLARRYGERGIKRVRYAAVVDGAGLLATKAALLGTVGHMLQRKLPATVGKTVRRRLDRHGQFYLEMRELIETRLRELEMKSVAAAA